MSSSDYSVHELPDPESDGSFTRTSDVDNTKVLVDKALLSRIELLEAENTHLRAELQCQQPSFFRIESIAEDDMLVTFYTGLHYSSGVLSVSWSCCQQPHLLGY